jgi:hypothetical protein
MIGTAPEPPFGAADWRIMAPALMRAYLADLRVTSRSAETTVSLPLIGRASRWASNPITFSD